MNAQDLYGDREDLMTAEELEEWNHDPQDEEIPTYSPLLRSFFLQFFPPPDAEGKAGFLQRKPALGITPEILD